MSTVTLNAGTIHHEKVGPSDGRPVVFIHGYSMGSSLWQPLSERLAARGFCCLAPTWPLGAHTQPMREDAVLTMEGIAAMVGELLPLWTNPAPQARRTSHGAPVWTAATSSASWESSSKLA